MILVTALASWRLVVYFLSDVRHKGTWMKVLWSECKQCLRVRGLVCCQLKERCTMVYRMVQLALVDEHCFQIFSPVSNVVVVQYLHLSRLFLCMDKLCTGWSFFQNLPLKQREAAHKYLVNPEFEPLFLLFWLWYCFCSLPARNWGHY